MTDFLYSPSFSLSHSQSLLLGQKTPTHSKKNAKFGINTGLRCPLVMHHPPFLSSISLAQLHPLPTLPTPKLAQIEALGFDSPSSHHPPFSNPPSLPKFWIPRCRTTLPLPAFWSIGVQFGTQLQLLSTSVLGSQIGLIWVLH